MKNRPRVTSLLGFMYGVGQGVDQGEQLEI